MQTKFDVGDVVYVPMKILKIEMAQGYNEPEYLLRPSWKAEHGRDLYAVEKNIFNEEDILYGKAKESKS